MGVFKDYIFKTLKWPLIQHAGPVAMLAEGLSRSFDQVRTDIIWLRNQFNPWTSEESMIPAHSRSRGISRHSMESGERFRKRTIRAYAWHSLGGGQLGMPRILDHYGYPGVTMFNMRKRNTGRWAEFMPQVPVQEGMTTEDYQRIAYVANETKPARSILAGIQVTSSIAGEIYAGGVIITSVNSVLTPDRPDTMTLPGEIFVGGYLHTVARIRAA